MKEKILKIVYDYTSNLKVADEEFVTQIIDIVVDELNLGDYVKEISFDNPINDYSLCSYSFDEKKIYFSLDREFKHIIRRLEIENFYDTNESILLKMNLSFVNSIIHEVTHAKQYKKCLEGKDDLEKSMLELSLERNLYIIRNGADKSKLPSNIVDYLTVLESLPQMEQYYVSLPSERMATLEALKMEKEIAHNIKLTGCNSVGMYSDLRYLGGQLLGYDQCSPSAFVSTTNNICKAQFGLASKVLTFQECESNFANQYNFPLDERLYYGLPISNEEKSSLLNTHKKLSRKL